jgi:acetyl esterase
MAIPLRLRLLLLFDRLQSQDITRLTPHQARADMKAGIRKVKRFIHYKDDALHHVNEVSIPVQSGQIKLRVYKPGDRQNHPLIMFFHGGGWVQGDLDTHDHNCRRMARQNHAVVVSVDYRLAPEHPFPIPGEDCYAATCWAVSQAASLGADASKLFVMGDSAGGNMAAVVAMKSRDLGGPAILGQILIYPALDATLSTASIDKLGKGYFLTSAKIRWYRDHYCGHESNKKHPYLSPMFAEDLKGLPPALIITAEYDPLKEEGEIYAKRMVESGNEVEFREYKGMVHAFFSMPKLVRAARELEDQIREFITAKSSTPRSS